MNTRKKTYRLYIDIFDEPLEFTCIVRSDAIGMTVALWSQSECEQAELFQCDKNGDFISILKLGW